LARRFLAYLHLFASSDACRDYRLRSSHDPPRPGHVKPRRSRTVSSKRRIERAAGRLPSCGKRCRALGRALCCKPRCRAPWRARRAGGLGCARF
jgi:hypothetical protein